MLQLTQHPAWEPTVPDNPMQQRLATLLWQLLMSRTWLAGFGGALLAYLAWPIVCTLGKP